MKITPWPIELHQHPGFKKERNKKTNESPETNDSEENFTPERAKENAAECFEQPAEFREMVLEHVQVSPKEKLDGGNVFYMWLNKTCPVNCEFCFFKSPKKVEKSSETEITDEGIEKIIKFTEDAKLDKFVISGGGEPMKSTKKVNELTKQVAAETFVIVTSGFWAKTESSTDKCLSKLLESSQDNPHQPTTFVRLSLDSGHLEKLSKDKSFGYVNNIINWFSKNATNNQKFKFLIHTMEGDKTAENLLAELPIKARQDKNDYLKRSTQIQLQNGLNFCIEYSQVFESDVEIDLHDKEKANYNNETFRDFITHRRNGNMSLQFHGEDPKGAYFLLLYDGTTMIWGATTPDNEASIYKNNYQEMMEKNYDDILTLASIEKGPCYVQDIVAETNPFAVSRAVGSGQRDFYPRLLWEEDKTRLYASIRMIQEYAAEGRIKKETIEKWPTKLRALISLDKEELKALYTESPHTIIDQYLADPNLSAEKLIVLHRLVTLGHYAVTPEKMREQIINSKIPDDIKETFLRDSKKEFCLLKGETNESFED